MASVQRTKNGTQWFFVFYDKETKKYTWEPSGVEIDTSTPTALGRSKDKAIKALGVYEKEREEKKKLALEEEQRRLEEAQEEERRKLEEAQNKLFADLVEEWLNYHKNMVRPDTWTSYKQTCNKHIIPWFREHEIRIKDIKAKDIMNYFKSKMGDLDIVTLKKHRAYISSTLSYCRLMGYTEANPMRDVKLPTQQGDEFEGDWFDDDEMLDALTLARKIEEPIYPAIYLAGIKGLRRSEACALPWRNIDWKNKTMRITQTASSKGEIRKLTKNSPSRRTLPLTDADIDFFTSWKKTQEHYKKFAGNSYDHSHDGYICLQPDGKLISPALCTDRWKRFLENNNLEKIRFHDLRASYATSLLGAGVPIRSAATLMGHKKPTTMLKYYTRTCDEDLRNAVEKHAKKYC